MSASRALHEVYRHTLKGLQPPTCGPAPYANLLPGCALQDATQLHQRITFFGLTQLQSHDLKATASLWSKWHFSAVIAATLAAHCLLNRQLPAALDHVAVYPSAEGYTQRLHFAHPGVPIAADSPFEQFSPLFDAHLAPVISALATLSGVSPRVFWSNAGTYFEYFTQRFATHPDVQSQRLSDASAILHYPQRPGGQRNPLYQPLCQGKNGCRQRRLCCLRYRIPTLGYCANCPIECTRQREKPSKQSTPMQGMGV